MAYQFHTMNPHPCVSSGEKPPTYYSLPTLFVSSGKASDCSLNDQFIKGLLKVPLDISTLALSRGDFSFSPWLGILWVLGGGSSGNRGVGVLKALD